MEKKKIKYLVSLLNKILDKLENPNSKYEGLCHLIAYGKIFTSEEMRIMRFIVNYNTYPIHNAPATIPTELIRTNTTSRYYWRKYNKQPRILFIKTLINLLETNPSIVDIPSIPDELID